MTTSGTIGLDRVQYKLDVDLAFQPAPTPTDRHIKMPLRQRTRQQTRTQRINTERRLNAELDKPPPY
ncbi:hypothetical protein A5639_27790 [Mycolicibacterium conceptionense]|nr:hypothetical protein A5639_27790 [Mycolicibacterium conceptionense]